MRGTHVVRVLFHQVQRNTPAYAGNTKSNKYCYNTSREHPRVCGEHEVIREYRLKAGGTPPRMRGTPKSGWTGRWQNRNTPAYAGNTLYSIDDL